MLKIHIDSADEKLSVGISASGSPMLIASEFGYGLEETLKGLIKQTPEKYKKVSAVLYAKAIEKALNNFVAGL